MSSLLERSSGSVTKGYWPVLLERLVSELRVKQHTVLLVLKGRQPSPGIKVAGFYRSLKIVEPKWGRDLLGGSQVLTRLPTLAETFSTAEHIHLGEI